MNCDTCNFAAIFHCAHPKRYIQPFIEDCDLWKEGEGRVILDETVVCENCKKVVNINDAKVLAKGSRFVCKSCI